MTKNISPSAMQPGASQDAVSPLPDSRARVSQPANLRELVLFDARRLSGVIKRRKVSCVEVMDTFLDHIEEHNHSVNAIVELRGRSELLAEAAQRDQQLQRGEYLGWMHGFPHAVKASAKGLRDTWGSPIYKNQIATTDDLLVKRIKDAGAIVIGKTNMPEF